MSERLLNPEMVTAFQAYMQGLQQSQNGERQQQNNNNRDNAEQNAPNGTEMGVECVEEQREEGF